MITLPHTFITLDRDAIVSEIEIEAPPDRVFRALTSAEEVRRRSPYLAIYEMDVKVGGRWRLEMACEEKPYKGFKRIVHEGEILELDPPRLLVYTWLANFHDDPKKA